MNPWARAASRRFMRLGRIGWIVAAVYCGAMALMAAWAVLSWEDIYQTKPVDEMTYLVCLLVAAGCAAKAAHSTSGRRRYGWLALIGALTAWAVGEVVQIFVEIRPDDLIWYPSLTQVVLTVFPVSV